MAESKIVGYKKIFGFVLPDWVDESVIRQFVMFLLMMVAMLFVLLFLIWPKFDEIKKLNSTLSLKQDELKSLKTSKSGFDEISETIPEYQQNLILQAIPQVYSPENAVFSLRKLGNETPGLAIVSYTLPSGLLYEAEKKETDNEAEVENLVSFKNYPIKLTIKAPIESLLFFIRKVESSIPFGVVSDVNMQEVSKLAKSSVLDRSVEMDLEIMYYQAVLKKVNIAKIKPISDEEMKLVEVISGFTQINLAGSTEVPAAINTSGNLFGI